MTKKTLAKYAKKILEIKEKQDFSVKMLSKEFGISKSCASIILKKLDEEEILIRVKMIGLREPIYVLDDNAEEYIKELEEEGRLNEKM